MMKVQERLFLIWQGEEKINHLKYTQRLHPIKDYSTVGKSPQGLVWKRAFPQLQPSQPLPVSQQRKFFKSKETLVKVTTQRQRYTKKLSYLPTTPTGLQHKGYRSQSQARHRLSMRRKIWEA
jgi:hypothetical protein